MTDKEKDRLCRQIVDGAGDAVIFADRDGVIRLWNRAAEGLFGLRAEEAVGLPLSRFVAPPRQAIERKGRATATLDGFMDYGSEAHSASAATREGDRISIEYTVSLLRDRDGTVLGPVAVVRDVTAREHRDASLREKLAFLTAGQRAA